MEPGIQLSTFQQYAAMIEGLMKSLNIGRVPVLTAEDETAIVKKIEYHQDKNELLGFCGLNTDNPADHECLTNFHIAVGDDEGAYQRLLDAFKTTRLEIMHELFC